MIKDLEDEAVNFSFVTKDNLNLIQIFPATDVALNNNILLYLGTSETITMQYNVEVVQTECYTQKKIIDLVTPDYSTTVENQIYTIKI